MAKLSGRTKGALWLLIAPTALLILGFVAFAIINWVFSGLTTDTTGPATDTTSIQSGISAASSDSPEALFGENDDMTMARTIANVVLFIVSTIGVITWLPGIIIGIVLLATQPPKTQ